MVKAHLPYDGLIFDLDGTLWDSTAPVVKAWNEAITAMGESKVSPQAVQGIMGLPHAEVFRQIFPKAKDEDRAHLERACTDREMEVLRQEGGRLYPGVAEGLMRLAERYPLFVVSNCQSDYLEIFLQKSGIGAFFKDAECYGRTGLTKGENLVLVQRRNHLSHCAYIGDTAGDQIAAGRAGMDYYHVAYGFGRPERECLQFDNFKALSNFLLEFFQGEPI